MNQAAAPPRKAVTTNFFVGSLTPEIAEDDLRSYFNKLGEVHDVNLKRDRETGQSKNFAFVTFSTLTDEARKSVVEDTHVINDCTVRVQEARAKGKSMGKGKAMEQWGMWPHESDVGGYMGCYMGGGGQMWPPTPCGCGWGYEAIDKGYMKGYGGKDMGYVRDKGYGKGKGKCGCCGKGGGYDGKGYMSAGWGSRHYQGSDGSGGEQDLSAYDSDYNSLPQKGAAYSDKSGGKAAMGKPAYGKMPYGDAYSQCNGYAKGAGSPYGGHCGVSPYGRGKGGKAKAFAGSGDYGGVFSGDYGGDHRGDYGGSSTYGGCSEGGWESAGDASDGQATPEWLKRRATARGNYGQ